MAQNNGRFRIFLCRHSIAKVQKKYIKQELSWKYLLINKDQVLILSLNSLISSFGLNPPFLSEEVEVPWRGNNSESYGDPVVLHNSSLQTNGFEDNFCEWWHILSGHLLGQTTGHSPPKNRTKGGRTDQDWFLPLLKLLGVSFPWITIEKSLTTQAGHQEGLQSQFHDWFCERSFPQSIFAEVLGV